MFYVCSSANIKCCFQMDNTGDQPDSAAAAWSQQLTELAASVTTLQSQHREAASAIPAKLDDVAAMLTQLAAAAPTPEA